MAEKNLGEEFAKLTVGNSDINILLLGETGVGKSTFINSLVNYLTYSSDLENAIKGKLEVLIPSVININDKNGKNHKISVGHQDKNESLDIGESATQDVRTYVFPIWDNQAHVRIIDTPGMGDTRGIKQDDINSENILTYISQLNKLHAICLLFRPNMSRSTVFFKYCIAQIFSRLDKSASNNIIFVFTGTRGVNYGPGDTMDILHKTVDEIRSRPPHVQIPIGRNVFCFENEAFKYLVALQQNVEFRKSDREKFKESWQKSRSQCWQLIKYIVGDARNKPLEPHAVKNTNAVNEARRMIIHMAQPLADISELINDNVGRLQRYEEMLKMDNLSLDELKKKLYMPVVNLEIIKQTQPVTVCTSRLCSEIYKVGDINKWHYKQRCHDPCYLENVPKELVGSPELIKCAAIDRSTKKCIHCSCDFSIHMHIYYMTRTKEDTIKDDNVARNLNTKEKILVRQKTMITSAKTRKIEYESEQKIITETCAKAAHFLENNAITPFNDSYKEYIKYLITREKSLGEMRNEDSIKHLKRLLVEYEEAKGVFDKAKAQSGTSVVISPEEICNCIKALYKLKHTGNNIKMLYECQNKSREREYRNTEYIHRSISNQHNKNEGKTDKKKTKDGDNKKTKDSDNTKTRDSDNKTTRDSDNKKSYDTDNKRSTYSDREGARNQRRDNNYPQRHFGRNYSGNFPQHFGGTNQYPRDPNYHLSPNSLPPLMGINTTATPPRTFESSGCDINIKYNGADANAYGAAYNSYSNLPPQGNQYGYHDNSYSSYGQYSQFQMQPQGAFPSYNYHDPGAQASGYYQQPNAYGNYPPPYNGGYHESQGGYGNHPYHSGSYRGDHFTKLGNRQLGDRRRETNRSRNFRGGSGRGRGGVNKSYKSGDRGKKYNKKERDSDTESSSCDSSEN